jgi:scyllo-inositol 2-dehydrogenase (NADP+)
MRRYGYQMKRVVIFGYGLAGKVFHAPLIRVTPDLEVVGILTSDPDRQLSARTDFPDALVTADIDQLWALSPDIAVIAGANESHVPLATESLQRGINVVVDKPITPDAASANVLADLAREKGLTFFPFHNRRWDSDYLTLKAVVDKGIIGVPHRFESRMQRFRLLPKGGWRDLTTPEAMGGVLYDFAPHLVDQALDLMGPVESVQAFARTLREVPSSDDDLVMILGHARGALSYLVGSLVSAIPAPRFELFGNRGAARISQIDTQEDHLKAGEIPGAGWGVEPADSCIELWTVADSGETTATTEPLLRGNWPQYYQEVSQALHYGVPPTVSVDQAIQTMRVLDAARESVISGHSVQLDPPATHA